jgi:hypothetical protein
MSALAKRDDTPIWFFWFFGAGALGYGGYLLYQFLFPETEDIMSNPSTPIIPPALQEEGFRAGRSVGMVQLMTVGPTVMSIPTGQAYLAMAAAALSEAGIDLINGRDAQGRKALYPLSGFRTMAQQIKIKANPPVVGGRISAVATPGKSNHQGGVAVDIGTAVAPPYGPESNVFQWLTKNAARFGFDHKEGASPSVREPWHWTHLASMLPFV